MPSQYIWSICPHFVAFALSYAATCTRVRAFDIRGCRSSSDAPDGSGVSSFPLRPPSPPPLLPPPSPPPHPSPLQTEQGKAAGFAYILCLTHTVRFNISGHGWKLSPETQIDTCGTIGPDERRYIRHRRWFPLSHVNDVQVRSSATIARNQ